MASAEPEVTILELDKMDDQASTKLPRGRIKLRVLIRRLEVLAAQGYGDLPVLIETRSHTGEVIYATPNARKDKVVSAVVGLRKAGTQGGDLLAVIRIG